MEVVSEVVAVCSSIVNILSKIDNVKEEWFTASSEFRSEARILRSQLASYAEQIRVHQQPVDSAVIKTLKTTESMLKRADERFNSLEDSVNNNRCCSQMWWLYAKVTLTLFPERLESTLKKVNQELDDILKVLEDEQDLARLLAQAARNRGISPVLHNSNKYVPIEKSHSAVIKAIEDSGGPPMILLHGGVGQGKSTLATYMCERYGEFGEREGIFDHVIMVSCANTSISDLATKQYEILELLSPTSMTDRSGSKSWENIDAKSRIAKALQNFFAGKKIFMVLDGVSDKSFLYKMWEVSRDGKDDKILITSQWSNLCEDFKYDFVVIPMEDPTKEEARQILSSLVGLESNVIPANIQGIADEMIKATAGNPLALAYLASNFTFVKYARDKTRKRDWQDALTELSKLVEGTSLDNEGTAIVVGQNTETAPRSLWGAMKMCVDSVDGEDARRILFLLYACKGESIPEEVLRILCAGMRISSSPFKRAKDELRMRVLLKPTADTLRSKRHSNEDRIYEECSAWSLLTLVRLYLQQHVSGKQEMRAVIGSLISDHEFSPETNTNYKVQEYEMEIVKTETIITESDERKVTIALCALYFDHQHTDQDVTRALARASKISNLEDSAINDLRRKAIEPLIWLLDKPEEDKEWTAKDKSCVRKVLLDYICRRQLDNENISFLLKLAACPSAQLATLKAIIRITYIEDAPLLNENTIRFVKDVLDIMNLKQGFRNSVQESASTALRGICWKAASDKAATLLTNMSGVLDVLVHSLAIRVWNSDVFAQNAADAVAGLAHSQDQGHPQVIVSKQGLLPSLVDCLYRQSKPSLQVAAAMALRNLAGARDEYVKMKIANEEGAVVGVVSGLSSYNNDELQVQSAAILAALGASREESLRLRIAKEALVGLVNCLSIHENSELQTIVVRALKNLASRNESIKLAIVNEKGSLVGLINCLSKHSNGDLQTEAAWAVANLAGSICESLKLRIVNVKGALIGLVNCLSRHDRSKLQVQAARALANLTSLVDESVKLTIANEKGALDGLVNCLSRHDRNKLKVQVMLALANLASNNESLKLRIVNEKGVLVGLVHCLAQHDNSKLQTGATRVIVNLAGSTNKSLKLRIANEKGVLDGLVACLSKHANFELQEGAARALGNLASSADESLKLRIINLNGALDGLVNCLSQREDPDLQRLGAQLASNLARTPDAKRVLRGTKGLLQGLKSLVRDDVRWDIRNSAVQALFQIDPTLAKDVGLLSAQLDGAALSVRIFVKAKFGDFEGALVDANMAITMRDTNRIFVLKERGVLKRMMGDLVGALADLDQGLKLETNDYDMVKHRGYVKFLLNDMAGARADAKWALSILSSTADTDSYLGGTCVEYLGYKL